MIHQLPKWVEVSGFCLALNAGFVNAVGFLGFKHQGVSHLTGTSTIFSLSLANQQSTEALHLLLVILSFVIGATYSGLIIGNTALKLGKRYSAALITESLLLYLAMRFLNHDSVIGHLFASAACGLQNALTSTYSGAIVRTTHLSGLFTDLGVALGHRLRGKKTDRRKIILHMTLILGFILGGVIGATGFAHHRFSSLMFPCVLIAILAISNLFLVVRPIMFGAQKK